MELTWLQFRNQNHIRILNENEQIRQYKFYLDTVTNQIVNQNKGVQNTRTTTYTGFLLQEDLSPILQENNSGIYITSHA